MIHAGDRRLPFAPIWTDRHWLAAALFVWLGTSAAYYLTAPGRIDMFDGGMRHEVTESLIDIGVPAVRDPAFPGLPGRGGYRYAWYELGSSVAAIPFVLAGKWLGGGSLESRQFAFSMTTVPFAAGAVAALMLIYGRLGCSLGRAIVWALVAAFGTLLWPYAGSSFDAAMQAFFLLTAVWSAIEAIHSRSYGWATAAGASFAMLLNIQEAYVVLVASVTAALPISLTAVRRRLQEPVVLVIIAGAAAGIALIAAANFLRYGNPANTGRDITGAAVPVWGNPFVGAAGLLVSPAKSILLYSPTCILGAIGLSRLMKRDADRFAPVVAAIAIHFALISMLRFWHGEWAWGPRYLVATVPLVSIGLPFAGPVWRGVPWKGALCAAAVAVQCLAVSVDHQRYYFDRSLPPFFWLDERWMYRDSPLFARPGELISVLRRDDVRFATALVPGPRPYSMTSAIFGPPPELLALGREWTRQYLVFDVPRPWPFWSRYLEPRRQPGHRRLMIEAGFAAALIGYAGLFVVFARQRRLEQSAVPQPEEAEKKTRQDNLSPETYR